jgi:Fe-S oxidoreductase
MCPSYRATKDEKDTTRGRANVLREFLTQNTKDNPFNHPEIKTALDLCLSCKGCKSECPSNIDMATLKSEFLYQYQKSNGVPLMTKLLVHHSRLNVVFHHVAFIQNYFSNTTWFKSLFGVAKERSIPRVHRKTLMSWLKGYKQNASKRKLYLFCDEITNFYDVEIGKKAVKLLNALGYEVLFTEHSESGRAHISKGFLRHAKKFSEQNVRVFSKLISNDIPLIGIEPSAILSFRDEYPNLVHREMRDQALQLSKNVFLIEEFLANESDKSHINEAIFTKESKNITFHGHCHQKALSSEDYMERLLSLPKNYSVEILKTGCCGMAGTFGYEREHYDLSMKIGGMVLFPEIKKRKNDTIVANGSSCRHQITDGTGAKACHPIEVLYDALLN